MIEFLIMFLFSYGVGNFLSFFKMTEPIRNFLNKRSKFFSHLINCVFCCTFWTSMIFSLIIYSPTLKYVDTFFYFLIDGFVIFGITNIVFPVQNYIEKKTEFYE
jgi:hypothetical protein